MITSKDDYFKVKYWPQLWKGGKNEIASYCLLLCHYLELCQQLCIGCVITEKPVVINSLTRMENVAFSLNAF